jgi:RNA polymerase sigma-70 factor (ECF subfamily)
MPDVTTEPSADLQLLLDIQNGDEKAFERFYLTYYPRLHRFILRVTHRPDTVEELIQDTLMVVWEKPDGFDHSCKVSTWVFGIAYRKSLKSLVKAGKRSDHLDLDEFADVLADPSPTAALVMENANWIEDSLARLPPDQRAVVELTFHHGLHYREIAEILGCPENTVKTRMFHARKKLQSYAVAILED